MAHQKYQFKTLTEAYEAFSKECVPVEASVNQRDAMKKSFFAGMVSMQSMAFGLHRLSENDAMQRMKLWEFEALEYTMKTLEEALAGPR